MYKLNQISKDYIKDKIGVSFDKILEMNSGEIDNIIEKKINKKLDHKPTSNINTNSRGTPYLFLWRLVSLKKINKLLAKI